MNSGSTESLIDQLVDVLTPVRRILPLRAALAIVLGVWAFVLGLGLATRAPSPGLWETAVGSWLLAGVLGGLVLVGFGGSAAALAARVPGRETVFKAGAALLLAGLLAGAGVCAIALALLGFNDRCPLIADGMCLGRSVLFALPVVIGMNVLVLRGCVSRPGTTALLALAAPAALGAVVVHLTCSLDGPRHLLFGHLGAPLVLALVGALPLAMLLRRLAR